VTHLAIAEMMKYQYIFACVYIFASPKPLTC
jgi:hypothetical protein